MANSDRPVGFKPAYTLSGGPPAIVYMPVATTQTLAAGDAVTLASGQIAISTSSSGTITGVMAAPSVTATANTLVPVYVANSDTVFEGQCSGNSAIALIGTAVDIEGATGVMEVNENATTEAVIRIVGLHPSDEVGTNGRVYFVVEKSTFNGYVAAL
jgi:hypothetical protein